jgi:hypothetical protein
VAIRGLRRAAPKPGDSLLEFKKLWTYTQSYKERDAGKSYILFGGYYRSNNMMMYVECPERIYPQRQIELTTQPAKTKFAVHLCSHVGRYSKQIVNPYLPPHIP